VFTQYEDDLAVSCGLDECLVIQQQEADASFKRELADKDEQFTRFWRYCGLPKRPSHLSLDRDKFSTLLNPMAIMEEYKRNQGREVLNPPAVFEYSDSSAAAHYLADTAVNRNRAKARTELIDKAKSAFQESKTLTWHRLPPEQLKALMKKSHRRHNLNSLRMNGANHP
jgi:hypothetical protein